MKDLKTGVSRRSFLAGSLGTGLMMGLGVVLPGCSKEEVVSEIVATGGSRMFSPAVWFEINEAGEILVNIAKAEMGQHVGTALARIVAEELGADWESVSLAHVDTDPKWGYMVTGGSWSVVTSFEMLSRAGAAGRTVLIDAAAALLGVDAAQLSASNGVVSGAGQSLSFAEIVSRGDISRTFSDDELAAMPIKPAASRTLIGKETSALDVPAKSKGAAIYGLDAELPGMVYAHPIVAPTRYGSVITSIDDSAAKEISGYQQTMAIEDSSGFVQGMALVIADSFPAAMKATEAVKVEWDAGETASVSEDDILSEGKSLVDDPQAGVLFVNAGDTAAAMSSASDTLSATYRTSTALHFTLEPQNALVEFRDGQCHVHAGNQWQSLIIPVLAQSLDMQEEDIVLHTYYLGGGFGRRLFGDQMIPAAHAARALGKPVKLVMTRPADSLFDCARSPSVARLDAAFAEDGSLSAIDHAAAAGWPTLSMAPGFLGEGVDGNGKFDGFSINGADHWYDLDNHRVRAINNTLAQETFLPGWLRSVGPGWIAWGVESFMDEIAVKLGMDPLEYRLSLLNAVGRQAGSAPMQVGGASRLAAVLKDVQMRSGWGSSLPEGEALGVAVAHGQERAMPTWSACVAHVAVDGKNVTVKKLWQTLDCGTVVHPDGALAQAEGATLWGLSLALHEGTAFENGQVRDRNLDSYKPLRMADVPELDIKFMESDEFPTGLGEPPFIAVAPAIGNAIFAATGQRVRDLPIRL
ncbi:molybdopterin cofactor-binding domain-containing protein [Congregibacter sp.]|uniref:xanthine dehydrogenase family protein molybdopterin-binding subunit n=1 Tax=Congregibacter sp. TaxID=2744308 RepID=UPI003F6BB6E0